MRPLFDACVLGAELAGRMAARTLAQIKLAPLYSPKPSDEDILIKATEREKAISFLKDWFEHEIQDYLKICDPYFGPEDLEVLQMLLSVNRGCRVQILTSLKHQRQVGLQPPWEEAYNEHWRTKISSVQNPPDTDIVIVGIASTGESPIHDRWWITKGGGLILGTSFNSLGRTKESEISLITSEKAEVRERQVDQYLQREKREHNNNEKILYSTFTLLP